MLPIPPRAIAVAAAAACGPQSYRRSKGYSTRCAPGASPSRRLRVSPPPHNLIHMNSFHPLRRGEGAALGFLVAFAAFAFIPAWRTVEVGGMALFGWLIAALMLISPAVALFTFLRRDGGAVSAAATDPVSDTSGDRD